MDFPLFFIDHVGNRLMMAVVAILHVLVNHPFAVGGYPLLVLLERWGHLTKNKDVDDLTHNITFVFFIVTTTIGALTGVGIWLTSALIAPFAIGSLLRVFFVAWAIEWIVFIIELVLILAYYLTWKKWTSGLKKGMHIFLGFLLSMFSWITMAIITAILGFMMNPGRWKDSGIVGGVDLAAAVFNPIYLPQLAFRTTYSMVTGGLLVWFLLSFFTKKDSDLRTETIRRISWWILFWLPFFVSAALWYWNVVPGYMKANVDIAMFGAAFSRWHQKLFFVDAGLIVSVFVTALWASFKPRKFPAAALIVPFFFGLWVLGHFERVREFLRKPYIISGYMYANGIRITELPVLQRDGMLTHATYVKHHKVTEQNKIEAGGDVFMIACSRCHTSSGMNGLVNKFNRMYGKEWNRDGMGIFIQNMGKSHPYMPPFPGTREEAEALIAFLEDLKENPRKVPGVQDTGLSAAPLSEDQKDITKGMV